MNAKEYYIEQGSKNFSNTENIENVNLVDVWLFAEKYHQAKLKSPNSK